jgi:hypothetical protein
MRHGDDDNDRDDDQDDEDEAAEAARGPAGRRGLLLLPGSLPGSPFPLVPSVDAPGAADALAGVIGAVARACVLLRLSRGCRHDPSLAACHPGSPPLFQSGYSRTFPRKLRSRSRRWCRRRGCLPTAARRSVSSAAPRTSASEPFTRPSGRASRGRPPGAWPPRPAGTAPSGQVMTRSDSFRTDRPPICSRQRSAEPRSRLRRRARAYRPGTCRR